MNEEGITCWVCGAPATRDFLLPLQVGSHPCAEQQVYLCHDDACDLALILEEWKSDLRLEASNG